MTFRELQKQLRCTTCEHEFANHGYSGPDVTVCWVDACGCPDYQSPGADIIETHQEAQAEKQWLERAEEGKLV